MDNIKTFLTPAEKNEVIVFCKKLIANDFSIQNVVTSIDIMARVTSKILPLPPVGTVYESDFLSILIDDIINSNFSAEEKNKQIENLINISKFELQQLVKNIFNKIDNDINEAIDRGFCSELLKQIDYTKDNNDI